MTTRKFLIWRADFEYGAPNFVYIEDSMFLSYGYAPGLLRASLNWIAHIPNAIALRKLYRSVNLKSQEAQRRQDKS